MSEVETASSETPETLTGFAEGDFFDLTLRAAGAAHTERSAAPLVLRTDGGALVSLDLDAASYAANVDTSGAFGALLERGLGRPFLDRAPGDHVDAHLHGITIARGDAVAVRGAVEHRRRASDAYREAALEPVSARVSALAVGTDTANALAALATVETSAEPTAPLLAPPSVTAPTRVALWPVAIPAVVAVGLAVYALLAAALDEPRSLGALLAGVMAGHFAAITPFFAARRRYAPDLRSAVEEKTGMRFRTWVPTPVIAGGVVLALASAVGVLLHAIEGHALLLAFAPLSAMALLLSLWLVIGQRRALGRLWFLARAPTALSPGRTGAMDGQVIEGSATRRRRHTIERETSTDSSGRSSTTRHVTYEDEVVAAPLRVRLTTGLIVSVNLDGGAFAAEEPSADGLVLVDSIEVGDQVRVVGRPAGDPSLWEVSFTGPGSLYVLGSKRRTGLAAARRALLLHSLAVLALTAIGTSAALFGWLAG